MRKLVLIGGGSIRELSTFTIDKRIVELTGKAKPKALFIPTASNDEEEYCFHFHNVYGNRLGCTTDVLKCIKSNLSDHEMTEKIMSSDLVYLGGGNYPRMIKAWKELGLHEVLIQAYNSGIVMAGISAGSIFWFNSGFRSKEDGGYTKNPGIGIISAFHCPHYNQLDRATAFVEQMKNESCIGLAIEDDCAIECLDMSYKIVNTNKNTRSYKLINSTDKVRISPIEKSSYHRPLAELIQTD